MDVEVCKTRARKAIHCGFDSGHYPLAASRTAAS
jgi:hypothetical protein